MDRKLPKIRLIIKILMASNLCPQKRMSRGYCKDKHLREYSEEKIIRIQARVLSN